MANLRHCKTCRFSNTGHQECRRHAPLARYNKNTNSNDAVFPGNIYMYNWSCGDYEPYITNHIDYKLPDGKIKSIYFSFTFYNKTEWNKKSKWIFDCRYDIPGYIVTKQEEVLIENKAFEWLNDILESGNTHYSDFGITMDAKYIKKETN